MPAERVTSATPWHVILVLDDSGSMAGEPARSLNAAVDGMFANMQAFSQGKKPYYRLTVVSFGSHPKVLAEAVSEQDIDIAAMTQFSGSSGSTDTAAALNKAIDVLRRNGGQPTDFTPYVFLMSDGVPDDDAAAVRAAETLKALEIPAGRPRLISIGTQEADEAFMKKIASSPELYVFCDPETLKRLFPEIGTQVGGLSGGGTAAMDQVIADAVEDTTDI